MFRRNLVIAGVSLALCASPVFAQTFSEEFEDITTLEAAGWAFDNNSFGVGSTNWGPLPTENPLRAGEGDFQGNSASTFPAYSGAPDGYIADNYNATTGASTISDWLITPMVTIQNGDTVAFWTRGPDASSTTRTGSKFA